MNPDPIALINNFTGINIFGDSLLDTGNIFNLTGGATPSADLGYFNGRFSNGFIWLDRLAEALGLSFIESSNPNSNNSNTDGVNYAAGEATTTDVLNLQIPLFTANNNTTPAGDLNVILVGANDYGSFLFELAQSGQIANLPTNELAQLPETVTSNIETTIQTLYNTGARNFLVGNLPDLGKTPSTNNLDRLLGGNIISQQLDNLTAAHNQLLEFKLNNLRNNLPEINLTSLDLNSLFSRAINNPRSLGLINVTDAFLPDFQTPESALNQLSNNPYQFLFWDDVHPTNVNHRLIGELAISSLQSSLQNINNNPIDPNLILDRAFTSFNNNFSPVEILPLSLNQSNLLDGLIFDSRPTIQNNVNVQLSQNVLDLGTEASFDNLVGFYEIIDINGGIDTNNDGIADLTPEQDGYANFAIANRISNWELRAGSLADPNLNTTIEQFGNVIIAGERLFTPFVIANGGEIGFDGFIANELNESSIFNNAAEFAEDLVAYFAFVGANPDGVRHIEARGNNTYGFEDLPANLGISDNDFNDAVFQFHFDFPV